MELDACFAKHRDGQITLSSAHYSSVTAYLRIGEHPPTYSRRERERRIGISQKLPVQLITLTIGRAIPPDAVKNQRIETATQEQRIQTEQQKKLAEDARAQPEQSRAKADNAYREAMQLSPEQFIQLESVKMMERACSNGNCYLRATRDIGNCGPALGLFSRDGISKSSSVMTTLETSGLTTTFPRASGNNVASDHSER
jgi:hypothetical protein